MERLVPVFHLQGLSLTVLETAFRSINRKPPGFLSDMKQKKVHGLGSCLASPYRFRVQFYFPSPSANVI